MANPNKKKEINYGNMGGSGGVDIPTAVGQQPAQAQQPKSNPTTEAYSQALSRQDNINQYYQMAKDQEYSALLDKEVQLENAKANALKYTQNSINAMGMGSQGYGSSVNSGIYNNYLNAFANAQNTYQSNVNQLNQAERNEILQADNEDFENLTTSIVDATDRDSLDALMSGYGVKVEDGKLVKPDNMTDKDFALLQYYYIGKQNEFDSLDESYGDYTGQVYANDNLKDARFRTNDGDIRNLGSNGKILNPIILAATNGEFANGDVIKYEADDGNAYLRFTTNGWQIIDKKTYNDANKKKWIATKNGLKRG